MMALQIPSDLLDVALEEAEAFIEPHILQRGLDYCLRGAVIGVGMQHRVVSADVKGSDTVPYRVAIDLDFFRASSCSCPYGGYCKHIAAVLFQLSKFTGRRPELVHKEMRNHLRERRWKAELAVARKQRAKEKKLQDHSAHMDALIRQSGLPETASFEQWQDFFAHQFKKYVYISESALNALGNSLDKDFFVYTKSWNNTLRQIFRLHVCLLTIEKIDTYSKNVTFRPYHMNYAPAYEIVLKQCLNLLDEALSAVNWQAAHSVYAPYIKPLILFIAARTDDPSATVVNWFEIYRTMWQTAFYEPEWLKEEQNRLREAVECNLPPQRDAARCRLIHFHVMNGDDDTAFAQISELTVITSVAAWYFYLNDFLKRSEWDRLYRWLSALLKLVNAANREEFRGYLHYWRQLIPHRPVEKEWEAILNRFLPYSYPFYAEYLRQSKLYADWADLMMLLGFSAENIGAMELREAEKAAPECLLPLFHIQIERDILKKNREAYRDAVRAMKKLRGFYQNMKQEHCWEQYINGLLLRFSRLKAFQDELKKGKITS